jgi:hypothetical protein
MMSIEEVRAMPGSYMADGLTTGDLCVFWDGEHPQEWTVASYSHSEVTTPIHRHWTESGRYFHHVQPIREWTRLCGI